MRQKSLCAVAAVVAVVVTVILPLLYRPMGYLGGQASMRKLRKEQVRKNGVDVIAKKGGLACSDRSTDYLLAGVS